MEPAQKVKPPWTRGLVFVCRACDGDGKAIRNGLREAVADAGLRKAVRVVMCGCLDICPKRATVAMIAGPAGTECTIVRKGKTSARELRPLIERFMSDHPELLSTTIAHREE